MAQQTAVEWLYRWYNDNQEATIKECIIAFEQAKAMEKEQIMQSYNDGKSAIIHIEQNKSLETYYNETYNK